MKRTRQARTSKQAGRPRRTGRSASLSKGGLLSQTAEYALRVMAAMAAMPPGAPARATDLAPKTGVPPHYLSKVLRKLVGGGLLVSQRGHGGGFVLARPASKITFTEVLTAVDGIPARGRCAFGWESCGQTRQCPIHPAWKALNDLFLQWAGTTTIAQSAAGRAGSSPVGPRPRSKKSKREGRASGAKAGKKRFTRAP